MGKPNRVGKGMGVTARLRAMLTAGTTAYGMWVTLESPAVTEAAAELGIDWVCVDLEHGHLGYREVIEHARALRGTETAILVRVPIAAQDTIKRALDGGVDGVMLPLVRDRAELERAMSFARYPPVGERGLGGERAVRWGLRYEEYVRRANDEVMVVPLIETPEAVDGIDAILSTPGLAAVYFGPADLSARYGYLGEWEGPGVAERILEVRAKAAARGIAAGVNARGVEDSLCRRDQGFGMVGLGSDVGLLLREATGQLRALRGEATAQRWF
jgi:2-keto-3-deoxy-L-rhamnonate aldolase RhmA